MQQLKPFAANDQCSHVWMQSGSVAHFDNAFAIFLRKLTKLEGRQDEKYATVGGYP